VNERPAVRYFNVSSARSVDGVACDHDAKTDKTANDVDQPATYGLGE
jgi:hypothetical protein